MYVNAAIDETVLPLLAVDQPSAIFFPGDGAASRGRVSRISWEADRQTHELLVEVTPDQLSRRVAIGQRADVRIELARRASALRVPIRMIQRDATGPYVFANRGGRIAIIRPRFGLSGAREVEVLGGLSEETQLLAPLGAGAVLPVGRRWKTP